MPSASKPEPDDLLTAPPDAPSAARRRMPSVLVSRLSTMSGGAGRMAPPRWRPRASTRSIVSAVPILTMQTARPLASWWPPMAMTNRSTPRRHGSTYAVEIPPARRCEATNCGFGPCAYRAASAKIRFTREPATLETMIQSTPPSPPEPRAARATALPPPDARPARGGPEPPSRERGPNTSRAKSRAFQPANGSACCTPIRPPRSTAHLIRVFPISTSSTPLEAEAGGLAATAVPPPVPRRRAAPSPPRLPALKSSPSPTHPPK